MLSANSQTKWAWANGGALALGELQQQQRGRHTLQENKTRTTTGSNKSRALLRVTNKAESLCNMGHHQLMALR